MQRVRRPTSPTKRGDTMIEVLFGTAIFSLIAVASIALMNQGLATAESTVELTLARNEINAQAEALRYIHSAFLQEDINNSSGHYHTLWNNIIKEADPSYGPLQITTCDDNDVYNSDNRSKFIALNTRNLRDNNALITDSNKFTAPTTQPQIVFSNANNTLQGDNLLDTANYTNINSVEGLWVIAQKASTNNSGQPQYYDFYIQSCWYTPNSNTPATLDTVIRLYNHKGSI